MTVTREDLLLTVPVTLMGERRDVIVTALSGGEAVTAAVFVGRHVGTAPGGALYVCAARLYQQRGERDGGADARVLASDGTSWLLRWDGGTVHRGRPVRAEAWADRVPPSWLSPLR